jgi:hypothetical protein
MYPLICKCKTALFVLALLLGNLGVAMEPRAFQRLLESIDNAFMSDRLVVIQTAAPTNTFSSEQVVELLQTLSFSSEQVEALETLALRLEDPQNAFLILDVFVFSSDRELAAALLSKVPPVKTTRVNVVNVYARLGLLSVYVQDDTAFQYLLSSVQAVSYSGDKLVIVEEAARETDGFTAQQAAVLLRSVSFSGDKLAMLASLTPRLIDLSGWEAVLVLEVFSSDNDKLEALGLIKHTLRHANDLSEVTHVFRSASNQDRAQALLSSLR